MWFETGNRCSGSDLCFEGNRSRKPSAWKTNLLLLVDFKYAYDRIRREGLYRLLKYMGVSNKLIRMN